MLIKSQVIYTHYTIIPHNNAISEVLFTSLLPVRKLGDRQVTFPFSKTLLMSHHCYLPLKVAVEKSWVQSYFFTLNVSWTFSWMLKGLIIFWSPVKFSGICHSVHSMSVFLRYCMPFQSVDWSVLSLMWTFLISSSSDHLYIFYTFEYNSFAVIFIY